MCQSLTWFNYNNLRTHKWKNKQTNISKFNRVKLLQFINTIQLVNEMNLINLGLHKGNRPNRFYSQWPENVRFIREHLFNTAECNQNLKKLLNFRCNIKYNKILKPPPQTKMYTYLYFKDSKNPQARILYNSPAQLHKHITWSFHVMHKNAILNFRRLLQSRPLIRLEIHPR